MRVRGGTGKRKVQNKQERELKVKKTDLTRQTKIVFW